jgi:hypothetical protein
MSKQIKIYCEGSMGSHDYGILSRLFEELSLVPFITPIGSKKGAGYAINADKKTSTVKPDFYFLWRDRDFDIDIKRILKVPVYYELKKENEVTKGTWVYSKRTTIENYLLSPQSIWQYIETQKLQSKYKTTGFSDFLSKYQACVKQIASYQAVRYAVGELRVPIEFETSHKGKGSGFLPESLELAPCVDEAFSRISIEKEKVKPWTKELLMEKAQAYLGTFTDEFYEKEEYLIWFQGKDLEATLKLGFPNFEFKSYYKATIKSIDLEQFSDLVAFKTLIEDATNGKYPSAT